MNQQTVTEPEFTTTNTNSNTYHLRTDVTVYVDIDNVLADSIWRVKKYRGMPTGYGRYENVIKDKLIRNADKGVEAFKKNGNKVVILTARLNFERTWESTRKWLKDNRIVYDDLVMVDSAHAKYDYLEKECKFGQIQTHSRSKTRCILVDDLRRLWQNYPNTSLYGDLVKKYRKYEREPDSNFVLELFNAEASDRKSKHYVKQPDANGSTKDNVDWNMITTHWFNNSINLSSSSEFQSATNYNFKSFWESSGPS